MPTRIPTAVVGSYPQPDWLVDRSLLKSLAAPRLRAPEIWRIPAELLEQAQDDATILAIRDQERAGIDVITDGEIRRESYSNKFANALAGIDTVRHGEIIGRTGSRIRVPLVTGPIKRLGAVEVRDVEFLRANTQKAIKITVPGPFTLAQQAQNEHYTSTESLALAFADAVNAEVRDLFAAGADIVQLDEPWLEARVDDARKFGLEAINRALAGIEGVTALHLCFGYAALVKEKTKHAYGFLRELEGSAAKQISIEAAQPDLDLSIFASALTSKTIIVGVLDLDDPSVETAAEVAQRLRAALEFIPPERLVAAPDCGMKYLPRATAFGKLKALAAGTAIVNAAL